MNEEQRYTAIVRQIKDLYDAATTDTNPVTNLLRALLCARMYEHNESAHHQVLQARISLIETLHIVQARKENAMTQTSEKDQALLSVIEGMRDWFLINSNEVVGLLTKGSMPHEQFFKEQGLKKEEHQVFEKFVDEMLYRQPYKGVLGSQAYRYLRMAVLSCLSVRAEEWPNYR